jgi:protein TonB
VLRQVIPEYPGAARSLGVTGMVVLRIVLDVHGQPEPDQTRVLKSIPSLDSAAIAAVHQWRFTPALGPDGRPVRVLVDVPLNFSLR